VSFMGAARYPPARPVNASLESSKASLGHHHLRGMYGLPVLAADGPGIRERYGHPFLVTFCHFYRVPRKHLLFNPVPETPVEFIDFLTWTFCQRANANFL
jgi:hypothetical protein